MARSLSGFEVWTIFHSNDVAARCFCFCLYYSCHNAGHLQFLTIRPNLTIRSMLSCNIQYEAPVAASQICIKKVLFQFGGSFFVCFFALFKIYSRAIRPSGRSSVKVDWSPSVSFTALDSLCFRAIAYCSLNLGCGVNATST